MKHFGFKLLSALLNSAAMHQAFHSLFGLSGLWVVPVTLLIAFFIPYGWLINLVLFVVGLFFLIP